LSSACDWPASDNTAVPETFIVVAETLFTHRLFEAHAFPWTVKEFPELAVPMPTLEFTRKLPTFAVPEMFAEGAEMFTDHKL
jgi:hypothetical protein